METVPSLVRRLAVARTIHSIVRNMKTLASASIRHFDEAASSLEHYAQTVELGLQIVLRQRPGLPEPTRTVTPEAGLIVLGSSLGLAGRFNERMALFARRQAEGYERDHARLMVLGGYLGSRLEAVGLEVERELPLPTSVAGIGSSVQALLAEIERWRGEGVTEVVLCFHSRHLQVSFMPRAQRLLPVDTSWLEELRVRPWPNHQLPTHAMDWQPLFSALVREHIFVQLYRCFAESLAAEQTYRLESMSAAQRNIERRLEVLQRTYQERRQAMMTEELLDIVNGWQVMCEEEDL